MAISRPLTGVLVVGAATGGPYAVMQSGVMDSQASPAAQVSQVEDSATAGWFTAAPSSEWPSDRPPPKTLDDLRFEPKPLPEIPNQTVLTQPRIQALQEVLRFDISPAWVMQRFPRVSTVLSEVSLDGLRVPLITGTQPYDLAGTSMSQALSVPPPTRLITSFSRLTS